MFLSISRLDRCTFYRLQLQEHKNSPRGRHCPSVGETHFTWWSTSLDSILYPYSFQFSLSHSSSALCQCHFTTFHFDFITSVQSVFVDLCTLKVCSFSRLKAKNTEQQSTHWSFHLTLSIFAVLWKDRKSLQLFYKGFKHKMIYWCTPTPPWYNTHKAK